MMRKTISHVEETVHDNLIGVELNGEVPNDVRMRNDVYKDITMPTITQV